MRKLGNKYEDINNFDDAVDSVKHMSTVQRKVTKWIIVILVSALVGGISGWKFMRILQKRIQYL